jgi:hypothetical protein
MKLGVCVFSIAMICGVVVPRCHAQTDLPAGTIIPAHRRIDWRQSAGRRFQIPSWPNGKNARTDYGAKADGATDDTIAIRNCALGTAVNTFCYLPAGNYRVSAVIAWTPASNSRGIRGDGPGKTNIIMTAAAASDIFRVDGGGYSHWVGVKSGATKGSTRIYVDSADGDWSSYATGQLVLLSQANGELDENTKDYEIDTVAQILKVVKGSNYLDLTKPLNFSFNQAFNPNVARIHGTYPLVNPGSQIGIENLTIKREKPESGYLGGSNIKFRACENCWVKNVHSIDTWNFHVNVDLNYGTVIRDSRFEQTWQLNCGGNSCYGAWINNRSTDCLVENNIFKHTRHSLITEYGGTGNIFGYNYSLEPLNENGVLTDYLMGDISTHGGEPRMNLWEGNTAAKIQNDNVLGSARWNTYFRNNVEVKSIPTTYVAMYGLDLQIGNLEMNYLGNAFGTSGRMTQLFRLGVWKDMKTGLAYDNIALPDPRPGDTMLNHGNYDALTKTVMWQQTITNRVLPSSLYLDAKPAWWGSTPWPPHGPDVSGYYSKIPAQLRYEGSAVIPMAPSGLKLAQ